MNASLRLPLPERVRTLFISDLHLGSSHCQPVAIARLLESYACERIYLVGDVLDLWWMAKRRAAWGREHTRVVELLRDQAQAGTELVYIPGNHDRPLRQFNGLMLPNMRVRRRAVHTFADGKRFLVTHGDEFDAVTHLGSWKEWLGDKLYDTLLAGNRWCNQVRQRLGRRYWSLAEFVKRRSDAAERYIERYVQAGVSEARRRGLDGIVCGHIHRPALQAIDGVIYANDGDWVESLTALAESHDGALSLLHFDGVAFQIRATLSARAVVRPALAEAA